MILRAPPPTVDIHGNTVAYTMAALQQEIYKESLILEDTTVYRLGGFISHCTFLQLKLSLGKRLTGTLLRALFHMFFDKRNDFKYKAIRFCPVTDNAPFQRLHHTFGSQCQAIYNASCTQESFYLFFLALYCIFCSLGYRH